MAQDALVPGGVREGEVPASRLRVLAADGDPAVRRFYEEALPALGYQVCAAATGRQAVELCRLAQPDLVVTESALPDLDCVRLADDVCRHHPVPFVVAGDRPDLDLLLRAPDGPFLAYVPKPVTLAGLAGAVAMAVASFRRLRHLWEEGVRLRRELEARDLAERARGLLVRYSTLSEEEAWRRLREATGGRDAAEVARRVVEAGEVFRDLEQAGEAAPISQVPARRERPRRPAGRARGRVPSAVKGDPARVVVAGQASRAGGS